MSGPLPVVEARGLSKSYRTGFWKEPIHALVALDFAVFPGEVFAFVGPNGSGKTTTLKLLMGLARPSAGQIRLWGRSPTDVDVRARVGFLPEESYLPRFMTGREALDFYARLYRMGKRLRAERVEALLSQVGLADAAQRPIREYSKGMARRVGLAQALLNDPELVVLDEPTSGLDPLATREVKDLIVCLKQAGKTVIVSSHLLSDLESICDRLVILAGGCLKRQGAVVDLLTETHRTLLEIEGLARADLEALKTFVAGRGGRLVDAPPPRKTLEAVFLEAIGHTGETPNSQQPTANTKRQTPNINA